MLPNGNGYHGEGYATDCLGEGQSKPVPKADLYVCSKTTSSFVAMDEAWIHEKEGFVE